MSDTDDDRATVASELERDAQSADKALGRDTHFRLLREQRRSGGGLR